MYDALTLLVRGQLQTGAFARASYPLAWIQDAFDTLAARPRDLKTQIVIQLGARDGDGFCQDDNRALHLGGW